MALESPRVRKGAFYEGHRFSALLAFTVIVFVLLFHLFQKDSTLPFRATWSDASLVKVLVPGQGHFRELCRELWKDECFIIAKELPRWPSGIGQPRYLLLETKLLKYLKTKNSESFQWDIQKKDLSR